MQPLTTIRNWQLDQLRKAIGVMRYLVASTSPLDAHTYRDGGNDGNVAGWTALEVLCHLRDWDGIFSERFRVTVEQDNPPLPNADPAQTAIDQRYNEQDADEAVATWAEKREGVISYLSGLDESAWARTAQHSTRGPMTLMDTLMLMTWHDMNHIEQMVKILNGRQA